MHRRGRLGRLLRSWTADSHADVLRCRWYARPGLRNLFPCGGNAVALAIAQFRQGERGWAFVSTLSGVYGEGPDGVSFDGSKATFGVKALMPDDARCCLSGKQRYAVDLATGTVTARPKTPGPATPASGSRHFAPRLEGYMAPRMNTMEASSWSTSAPARSGTTCRRPRCGRWRLRERSCSAAHSSRMVRSPEQPTRSRPAASRRPTRWLGRSRGSTIVLRGRAPRRDPNACLVTGMSNHGALTVLTFREFGDM